MPKLHLARICAVVGLVGAAVFAAVGAASAGQPAGWQMTVTDLPAQVAGGSDAGYQVTITNNGPSNISKLYLGTDTTVAPDFVTTSVGTCSGSGAALTCSFGMVRAGQTVTVLAAYPTTPDETSFSPGFFASTTGATSSDKGGASHGDNLRDPNAVATTVTNDPDFGGGFVVDPNTTVSTDDSLSSTNPQSTTVAPPVTDVVATVQDGPGVTFTCPTTTCFGEWSKVTVGNGKAYTDWQGNPILFPVTLTLLASQVQVPSILSIKIAHVLDDGTTQILSQHCSATGPPTLNCITVRAAAGGKLVLTAWVDQNGGFKGMG